MNTVHGLDERVLNLALMRLVAPSRQVRRRLERKGDPDLGFEPPRDRPLLASCGSAGAGGAVNFAQLMKYTGPIGEAFLNDQAHDHRDHGAGRLGENDEVRRKDVQVGAVAKRRSRWDPPRQVGGRSRHLSAAQKDGARDLAPLDPQDARRLERRGAVRAHDRVTVFAGVHKFVIELTVIFAAIGENKAEDVMRGWEVTGIWLNEGDLVAFEVFAYAITRVGRYPSSSQGGCQWRGVMLDMNAPDIENWTYGVFVEKDLGLDAGARARARRRARRNVRRRLPRPAGRPTKDASASGSPRTSRTFPGAITSSRSPRSQSGPGSSAAWSTMSLGRSATANPFSPSIATRSIARRQARADQGRADHDRGRRRHDAGGGVRPARRPRPDPRPRRSRRVRESEEEDLEQLGATAFGRLVGRYFLDEFPDCTPTKLVLLRSRRHRRREGDGRGSVLAAKLPEGLARDPRPRIRVKPAPTKGNRLDERLQAVRTPMLRLVEGGEPGFIICPVRCRILRRGFKGKYVIARVKLANGMGRFQDAPVKNDESHVQDANQYLCLALTKHGNGDTDPTVFKHPGLDDRPRAARSRSRAPTICMGGKAMAKLFRPKIKGTAAIARRRRSRATRSPSKPRSRMSSASRRGGAADILTGAGGAEAGPTAKTVLG
jgi:hypothetical protein